MKQYKEQVMKCVFLVAACASILAILLICLFLFINGIPAIHQIGLFQFLLGLEWQPANNVFGILPMILGSLYITAGALLVGVPLGLATAIYLAYFCPHKLYKIIRPMVDLMAGIPSVVYGFFGLMVVVPFIQKASHYTSSGVSILAASLLLGIMILPTIITVSENAIRAVPTPYYEGALALGGTQERSIVRVVVPAAKNGIVAGVVLGLGRAIGETMAVIMVAGNQARLPNGILRGVRTLTANIVLEMGYAADLHRGALIATGVVLFVFILCTNILLSLLRKGDKA